MIRIYNEKEIEILRRGGRILAEIMEELKKEVKPGVTTKHLNKVAKDLIFSANAEPSFEGYDDFPATLCTSINEEIVHAVPKERKLKKGDILSLDLGIKLEEYCTDMAITMPVGKISKEAKKLIKVTKETLKIGIKQVKPGNHLENIGYMIQKYVEKNGFNVVRELVGHGVGKEVHEEPKIPNYGERGTGPELVEGMVLALEPMVTVGDWHIKKTKDGFGYKTADNSLSCHFEHTIAITKKGPQILTQ
jgi:methionyl aminopeptidase